MRRSVEVYLADILDACDTIESATSGVTLAAYGQDPILRSAVERQFIVIGEAVARIRDLDSALVDQISHATMIIGFRNLLTHDYASVDDETVYGVATSDLPLLQSECADLLRQRGAD